MDSGNSGSMQSSSGGDEEYDSRADSMSGFLYAPAGFAALPQQYHARVTTSSLHSHLPAANVSSSSSPPLLDPLSVYYDGLVRSPPMLTSSSSPLRNLDMPWLSRGVGPSNLSSCTDVVDLMTSAPPPSNDSDTAVSFPMDTGRDLYSGSVGISSLPSSSLPQFQQQPPSTLPPQNPAMLAAGAATAAPPRTSKKRSRASRRASTTVLTTDTSNFRAMVQEFTGLPAPPFSSSTFPRARFDLLHAAASSVMRSSTISDASSHYLLRPFSQHLSALSSGPFSLGSSAPSLSPSTVTGTVTSSTPNIATTPVNATTVAATDIASNSMTSAMGNSINTSVATASAAINTNTASTGSYQLPSDHFGLQGQHLQSLPSMFEYTSLAPSFPNTKYTSASVPPMASGKKTSPGGTPLGPSMADYTIATGFTHGQIHSRPGTTQSPTGRQPEGMISSRGSGGSGEAAADDLLRWVDGGPAPRGSDRVDQFRPAGGSCAGSQRGNSSSSSCKMNYAGATPSDYHAEVPENVPSGRGEGMVESWICSSD